VLSRLQHGYPMDGPPDAKDLQPFVLSDIQASNPDVRAVRKAWLKVVRMGKEFGKRNILAKEPYTQWVKERVEKIQLPYILKAPAFPKTPEPEPILPEDMEKLATKVKELELENTELRIQMNRVILENQNLKEERKGKAQELEDSNKRARLLEDQKDDLDHILLGSTSVIRTRKEELKKAEYRICELGRLLDKSLMDKKEIKLDFEAQIRDLRDALKKCEEKLSREILQKEEAERNCHHLRYQLEEATRRFAVLESQEGDAAYLLLKNDCVYWKRLYREARATLDEDQKVIQKLQELYVEWNGKFRNLARFVNLNMLELPEKLQEADWCMCPENTPPQVFNFVKFIKKMMNELTTDLATIIRAETELKFTCT